MNKRWPPLADKTSLPYKLTTLSKQKLAREATAPDPDIRRCLGHFRLHCTSMEWAQRDMTSRINSFDLDSDSEEEEEEEGTHDEEVSKQPAPEVEVAPLAEKDDVATSIESDAKAETTLHVSFEVVSNVPASTASTPTTEQEKESLLEKGRSCLEKTVQMKHFWPARGPCLPVRIAG
ncbi:uncharacterized protein CDV56_101421 [Aspergillus thermomutatus]|uniref:Uncharacterized protein n=1 Tax=Aspergillus thermomutatus TaxID=41047 RepID=A0A397G3Q1_ASPTH|nr:uncharacterized protein CDV56_101421 [Aspergillus thermomutatus]RHZ43493.1 hypothetical protein CDV56_101421 [Aspergillus thermomutatus]